MAKTNDLRDLTGEELRQGIKEREVGLLQFRLQIATGVVDDVRAARRSRREIAQMKTILRERELAAAKGK